jgi:hypothetical protein
MLMLIAEVLHLANMALTGSVPAELWPSCTNLVTFSLAHNMKMNGTIPTEMGLLTNLVRFNLAGMGLGGTVPTEIGFLTALEQFIVYDTDLEGTIPSELGLLTNLERISMANAHLYGKMPDQVCALPYSHIQIKADCLDNRPVECDCCTDCYGIND